MKLLDSTDTIIACSSGSTSNCAISVIRISGINFIAELNPFFNIDLTDIEPRYAHYCKIKFENSYYDDVVLTFFKGPNSYNGQDILELSVHGNQINVSRIINLFTENSLIRHAEPGEFSYRALENKKLSLTQVEGLDLLLNANSIFSLKQGFSLLSGKLKDSFISLNSSYLKHRSSLELGFDFLEDIGEEQFSSQFNDSFLELKHALDKLYHQAIKGGDSLIRPEIALFGQPNAGKSTLFNALLSDDRAIVSSVAGTTRDYISESIVIDDAKFNLIDTAGIRKTADEIEQSGIKKALEVSKNAFYKILVINPFDFDLKNINYFLDIGIDLIIFTHKDLEGFETYSSQILQEFAPIEPRDSAPIEPQDSAPIEPQDSASIEPWDSAAPIEPLFCNLMVDASELSMSISLRISSKYKKLLSFDPILISRHRDNIIETYNSFLVYESEVNLNSDLAIISSELNIVGHCISELIGIVSPDDVLHNIFDNFCIGK